MSAVNNAIFKLYITIIYVSSTDSLNHIIQLRSLMLELKRLNVIFSFCFKT